MGGGIPKGSVADLIIRPLSKLVKNEYRTKKYEKVIELNSLEFRRLSGIKKETFERMVNLLKNVDSEKKKARGRKNKLRIEDQLLMTLEYLREYRTYFHIANNFGISESSAYKGIKWVEETLVRHPDFALPG